MAGRLLVLLLAALSAAGIRADDSVARRIAVTFDDLPTVALSSNDADKRAAVTGGILDALDRLDIVATGFVNEAKFTDQGVADPAQIGLLQQWLDAGHDLGNHGFSHKDLHRVTLEEFQDDVLRGDKTIRSLLADTGRTPVWFRHPYLHTGRDLEIRDGLHRFLAAHDYRVAPVTVDNSEWIFARGYVLALQDGDRELAAGIGREYVDYMVDMVAFYESQSIELHGRNIAHVLLVHANELNGDWFGELGKRLAERGYEFITLDTALADPVYESADTYTGPGGITWLHRWAITRSVDPAVFHGEPRTPSHILRLTGMPEHTYPTAGSTQ